MSVVGYKQTFSRPKSTSALPPTTDILMTSAGLPVFARRLAHTLDRVPGPALTQGIHDHEQPTRNAESLDHAWRRLPIAHAQVRCDVGL